MYVSIPEEDAAFDLGDGVRVRAWLLRPVEEPVAEPAPPPDFIYQVWTVAQVGATAITLGQALALATRRWRKKEPKLPPGTRLTLTVTLPDDGSERTAAAASTKPVVIVPAYIEIDGADTKTEDQLTRDIEEQLSKYVRQPDTGALTD